MITIDIVHVHDGSRTLSHCQLELQQIFVDDFIFPCQKLFHIPRSIDVSTSEPVIVSGELDSLQSYL